MASAGRVGVVPARFGHGVVGGAEAALAEMAAGLASRGYEVEILTTCARDHFTWENVFPAGLSRVGGLPVHRFPAVVDTPGRERAELEATLQAGGKLTSAQQQRWMNDGMRCPLLYQHIQDHGADYRAFVFAPYPFWITYACSMIYPERSILMPCMHDEPYAYLDIFRPVFQGVAGLLFLSDPEHALAHRIASPLAPHSVVGSGIVVPAEYEPVGFRERHGLERPFVLYAGRREGGKNWERLLEMFDNALSRFHLEIDLVTIGAGDVRPPPGIAERVVDLGFLPDDERNDAFAAAAAYVQPSAYESFSRTIMEAWLAGTLVIGSRASEVVEYHVRRSQAGLLYTDESEFHECLRFIDAEPELASRLGERGRQYVLTHYTWEDVLDRVEAQLDHMVPM
jgi:glycosyltransferase involved in cell wall biosynthesis